MTLRYQVDPGEPLTFMDVKVGKQVRVRVLQQLSSCIPIHVPAHACPTAVVRCQGNVAQARACYFDVANKWGAFGSIPLTAGHSMSPVFGLRYSSPLVTAGSMLSPTEGKLHCLWLVSYRSHNHVKPCKTQVVSSS